MNLFRQKNKMNKLRKTKNVKVVLKWTFKKNQMKNLQYLKIQKVKAYKLQKFRKKNSAESSFKKIVTIKVNIHILNIFLISIDQKIKNILIFLLMLIELVKNSSLQEPTKLMKKSRITRNINNL